MTISIDFLLNKTAGVARSTRVDNGAGGYNNMFGNISTIPIRVYAASQKDKREAGKDLAELTHIAYTRPDEDIIRHDEITIETKVYCVLADMENSENHHQKIFLQRKQSQ